MQDLTLTPGTMAQTPEHRLPYVLPASKLSARLDTHSDEPRVDSCLDEIRISLLACLGVESSRAYEQYCSHFDRYLSDLSQHARYPHYLYGCDTNIWRGEEHSTKGIESIRDMTHS